MIEFLVNEATGGRMRKHQRCVTTIAYGIAIGIPKQSNPERCRRDPSCLWASPTDFIQCQKSNQRVRVSVANLLDVPNVAVIFTAFVEVTAFELIAKVAVVAPAGTVTVPATITEEFADVT